MDICHKLKKFNTYFILVLMFTGLCAAEKAKAQEPSVPLWAITAIVNANLTSVPYYRDIYFPNSHGGFGVYAAYRAKPKFDIRFGVKANVVAYSRNATDNVELFTQRIREYYVETPLSVFYYPSRTERTWGFYAGITPSILANKWYDRSENNPKYNNLPDDPSKLGRFDFGVHVGASIKVAPRWSISADYTHSLTNKQGEAYNEGKFSQFSIGIGFQVNSPNPKESEIELARKEEIIPFYKKTTVLMVRLKTEAKKIQYYRNAGFNEDADELQEKVNEENDITKKAFRQSFTFCPVYFFYDTVSLAVREGHFENILLTEEDSLFTGNIGDTVDILIAEFGSPYSEAFGTESGFGLVIYDAQFNQMKDPFPYYTSTYYGLVSRKEVVARFDRRLREYRKMRQ